MRKRPSDYSLSGNNLNPRINEELNRSQAYNSNNNNNTNQSTSPSRNNTTNRSSIFSIRRSKDKHSTNESLSEISSLNDTESIISSNSTNSRNSKRLTMTSSHPSSIRSSILPSAQYNASHGNPATNSTSHNRHVSTSSSATLNPYDKSSNPLSRKTTNISISRPIKTNDASINTFKRSSFQLERPNSAFEIERMFKELLEKLNFKSLPPQATREMLNYDIERKWMMIEQDARADFDRQQRYAKQQNSFLPEEYAKWLMAKTITTNQLSSLWIALRSEPIDWVRSFVK